MSPPSDYSPLHHATSAWEATLANGAGLCLQTVAGTNPTRDRCTKGLELSRTFFRELDAEEHLDRLSKRDGRDLELRRHPDLDCYDVVEHMRAGTVLRGTGATPAKAIANAIPVLG